MCSSVNWEKSSVRSRFWRDATMIISSEYRTPSSLQPDSVCTSSLNTQTQEISRISFCKDGLFPKTSSLPSFTRFVKECNIFTTQTSFTPTSSVTTCFFTLTAPWWSLTLVCPTLSSTPLKLEKEIDSLWGTAPQNCISQFFESTTNYPISFLLESSSTVCSQTACPMDLQRANS